MKDGEEKPGKNGIALKPDQYQKIKVKIINSGDFGVFFESTPTKFLSLLEGF